MIWHYEGLYNFFVEKKDDAVCLIVADVHNVTGEPYVILHWVQKVNEGEYREYEVTETLPAVGAEKEKSPGDDWEWVRKIVRFAFTNDVPVYQVGRGRLKV